MRKIHSLVIEGEELLPICSKREIEDLIEQEDQCGKICKVVEIVVVEHVV